MTIKEAIEWIEKYRSDWEHECKSYHPMKEALQMAIAALEKQEAKKPINVEHELETEVTYAECPSCGCECPAYKNYWWESFFKCLKYDHCPYCGQKIDWTEGE